MNRTNWEHLIIALVMQGVIGLLSGNWWAGAAFGAAWFLGREHAQAEYRYIKCNGGDRYSTPKLPEIAAFNPNLWSKDSILDFVLPVAGVIVIASIISIYYTDINEIIDSINKIITIF